MEKQAFLSGFSAGARKALYYATGRAAYDYVNRAKRVAAAKGQRNASTFEAVKSLLEHSYKAAKKTGDTAAWWKRRAAEFGAPVVFYGTVGLTGIAGAKRLVGDSGQEKKANAVKAFLEYASGKRALEAIQSYRLWAAGEKGMNLSGIEALKHFLMYGWRGKNAVPFAKTFGPPALTFTGLSYGAYRVGKGVVGNVGNDHRRSS